MSNVVFDFDPVGACIEPSDFKTIKEKCVPEVKNITSALQLGYKTDYASVYAPSDTNLISTIKNIINQKKSLNIATIIVIGIGGSNLGTIAIHKALHGDFYNELNGETELKNAPKIYFADTVDSDYLVDIISAVEAELQHGLNILVNVITKSGTTTETIANFEIFLNLLKKYKNNYQEYVVATTDGGSALWNYAHEHNIVCLEVPKKVGGRFSVFTAVGLFPLGFLGVNIEKLLTGAQAIIKDCLDENLENNPAVLSAAVTFYHYKKGANIHDTFVFAKYLRNFGQWYRQLVGESIGKKFNKNKEKVEVGVTPTVSVGTIDLHSVAQLYLGGPQDKFTTFVTAKPNKEIVLPNIKAFDALVKNIQGKSLSFIMNSIVGGVKAAYKNDNRPFVSAHLPLVNEYTMGQLLQWKMLEIMYLGYLLNVNPFDQPQVELYKKETRKILAS